MAAISTKPKIQIRTLAQIKKVLGYREKPSKYDGLAARSYPDLTSPQAEFGNLTAENSFSFS